MKQDRYKVTITCEKCGERFTLRAKKGKSGSVQTGFKRCLCDNEQDFHITYHEV
ncbi:MAG: hypothetical protein H0Z33_02145 [Bacillaceae bacterium]|nr:hypothetical protein [Bacillaceae bacterium]